MSDKKKPAYERYADNIVEHYRELCTYDLQYGEQYFNKRNAMREAIYVMEMQTQALLSVHVNLTRNTAYIMVDKEQIFLSDSIAYLKQLKTIDK